MKKFISMVMAAAMVVSLVPATAFAADTASMKVVKAQKYTEDVAADMTDETPIKVSGAEIQLKVTETDNHSADSDTWEVVLDFANAEVMAGGLAATTNVATANSTTNATIKVAEDAEEEDTTIKLEVAEAAGMNLGEDDILVIDVAALNLILTSDNAGTEATVEVSGDFGDSDAMVFASVLKEGVSVTLKKVAEVAEEDTVAALKSDLKLEADVDTFYDGQFIELKLSKGFEWDLTAAQLSALGSQFEDVDVDEDVLTLEVKADAETITIDKANLGVEAVDAKAGDIATITVKVKAGNAVAGEDWKATAEAVDAVEVIADAVEVSVDEDEDVPVYYSGVNKANDGITEKDTHTTLAVTIEESVEDAWDLKDKFQINVPDGVYVVGMDVDDVEVKGLTANAAAVVTAFEEAYEEGDFKNFEFGRKTFVEANNSDKSKVVFTLEVVADPGFVGPVDLDVVIDGETTTVTVAEFVAPYFVEAAQNDVIIDYRYTAVGDVVVKEAEAGLWEDGLTVVFSIDKLSATFENEVVVEVNEESDMKIKEIGDAGFKVTTESDEEAAVVTLSEMSLLMNRTIAAGAYDLKATVTTAADTYGEDDLLGGVPGTDTVASVTDAKGIVKEAYVNVITAGRDQDDASFTKKVVVPVGEAYIVAGEDTITLDVPAYVSAAGYTMLPVRAVAVALGINTNNVLWDQATKTVTILYGQRIITMTVGSKVINVNGSAIPASASVEVVDGRTFLPMRDLATALGVTDITWDAATKTATLNGNK